MGYVKKLVNAGGMTQNQVNTILRLASERAWDLHPDQKMREFYAIHIGDVECNPATSPLTGGWSGTASKLIGSLMKLPTRESVESARYIPAGTTQGELALAVQAESAELATQGEIAIAEKSDEIHALSVSEMVANDAEIDPWSNEADNAPEPTPVYHGEPDPTKLVGPGVYSYNGGIFSVKESTKNPGRHYAHLITLVDGKYKHKYAPGVIFKLTEEMRVTGEQVLEMNRLTIREVNGKRVGSCCVCGRMLTKKASIDAGIGPICAGKVGL